MDKQDFALSDVRNQYTRVIEVYHDAKLSGTHANRFGDRKFILGAFATSFPEDEYPGSKGTAHGRWDFYGHYRTTKDPAATRKYRTGEIGRQRLRGDINLDGTVTRGQSSDSDYCQKYVQMRLREDSGLPMVRRGVDLPNDLHAILRRSNYRFPVYHDKGIPLGDGSYSLHWLETRSLWYIEDTKTGLTYKGPASHVEYRFKCKCKQEFEPMRSTELYPFLTKMALSGMGSISVRNLVDYLHTNTLRP